MKLKSNVSNLKEVVDILGSITNEAKLEFDSDGLKVRAIDSARIAMVDLVVPKESFVSYEVDEKIEVSVEIDKIRNVLRLASQSEDIGLQISGGKMKFSLGNLTKTLSTLDTFVNSPKLPTVEPKSYVVIKKSDLEKGLKAATDVRDSIRLTIENKRFELSSKSESEEVNLTLENEDLIEIKSEEKASSSYPLEFLIKIIRAVNFSDTLKVAFNNDYPLVMEFSFAESEGVKTAKFLLAPRME
jgi:proliferating cell nuclear antigen